MGILSKLFKKEGLEDLEAEAIMPSGNTVAPTIQNEDIPDALDLGWYYSENKDEYQMAKISEKDRATHFYVIGATGTGKTKFLEFLINQDIEKRNGFGVIDPHGDLIEETKGLLAYHFNEKELSERVVIINPTDPKYTVTFNPLEKQVGVSIPEAVNEIISSFRKIWSDAWGVRMEDLLRNSLIALSEAGLTLIELPSFLSKRAFRGYVLKKTTNPITKEYFQRFDTMTDRSQITWIEPVMNKINALFADERIREIFSSPKSSFNIRKIMDQRKVLLIKLDKGKLKDSSDLLGSLLMAKIQMAAFSRGDLSQERRIPFYLYIDEFQNFASDTFSVILSEARKYGLSLIMAHQSLAQISLELRSLILGNTGIQVYFRLNRQDANLLAKEGFDYSGYEVKLASLDRTIFWSYAEEWEHKIEELQNLPPRVCYIKHKIEGGIIPVQTVEIEPASERLGMKEAKYEEYLRSLPFGRDYLITREELSSVYSQRLESIKNEIKKEEIIREKLEKEKEIVRPIIKEKEKAEEKIKEGKEELVIIPTEKVEGFGKGGPEHRYLQSLIKRMAEDKGFRAIIEEPLPNNQGSVDIGLERNGKRIACEISLTTTDSQELKNIQKCLINGYDKIILCSPTKKTLEKVKAVISKELKAEDQDKVLFFQPEELMLYFEEEAASEASHEERVKGYKVKVQYQAVADKDKETKRGAMAQVILSAMKRLKVGK